MAQDIASLGVQVTTNGAQQAAADLDKLAASGDKAAASTARLGQASADAARKYASPQYRQQADDLAKLVGQIDPAVAKLGQLDAMQAKLGAFKKMGMLSDDDFNALNTSIEQSRVKVVAASAAVHEFGLNNAFARRELGRLASDAVNGNWGRFEQTSLTLANASGVMGLAFSGVGVAVAAAATAVGLGIIAYQKGEAETSAFNKALIQTGGIAGTTAGQLSDMAKSMATANTTTHAAADALAAVISTGKFTGDQLQTVAAAALQMQQATGQAIGDTVAQFVKLADDPAAAIVKFNDQQHFLTLAVYDQIKALQDQGRAQEAVMLAENTYAQAIGDRTDKIKANLGTLETAWENVGNAAAKAWDAMLSVGRRETPEAKLTRLKNAADDAAKQLYNAEKHYKPGSSNGYGVDFGAGEINDLKKKAAAAMQGYRAEFNAQTAANQKAQQHAAMQAANDAGMALAQEADKYASAEVKRARDIAKAHGDANAAIAKARQVQDADLRAKLITQAKANEQAIVAGIEARDKKPRTGSKADPMAGLNRLRERAYNNYDAAKQLADGGDSAQVKLYKDEATQLQAIIDASAKAIEKGASLAKVQALAADATAKTTAAYALESHTLAMQETAALKAYQSAIDQQIASKQRQLDLQVAAVGMGSKEAQQMQAIVAIYENTDSVIEQLNRQRVQKGADVKMIDGQIAAQKAALPVLVQQQRAAYAAMDAAQADWKNGFSKAYNDYEDQAQNVAALSANYFTSAFDSMGDALANFATTGKLNFKGLVVSILDDLAKMEMRIVASQALQALFGSFAMMHTPIVSNSDVANWSRESIARDIKLNAKGGVYDSPSLSTFSGQIVDKPTLFAFAHGAGVMGEAGPEAILPLHRGPDGRLGVTAASSGGFNFQQSIRIDNSGNATEQSSASQSNDLARQFGERMKQTARQAIVEEQRPGGLLWRMQHA